MMEVEPTGQCGCTGHQTLLNGNEDVARWLHR